MWSPVVHLDTTGGTAPSTRSKHAVSLNPQTNQVYVLGGRNGNVPLKDFWIFSIESGRWSCLSGRGGTPVNLQEHSMNYFGEKLYVFGGVFSQSNECPLWIFDTQEGKWNQWKNRPSGPRGQSWPQGRRAHTAVVFNQSLLVYGGYQDMRGSLSELWQFSFDSSEWKVIHGNEAKKSTQAIPPPRHRHSAVIYDEGMWVYGGMTDLQERSDLWRLDLVSKQWSVVKCKLGPGPLHSHSAVRLHSFMLLIGGEKQGNLSNEVWRFHFGSETWERLETCDPKPSARTQLAAVTFNVPLFTTKKRAAGVRSKQSFSSSAAVECSTAASIGGKVKSVANKSRGPLFALRNRGYHLVNGHGGQSCLDDEQADDDRDVNDQPTSPVLPAVVHPRESSRLAAPVPCWMTKSSTYSLLSNASTDSLIQPDDFDPDVRPGRPGDVLSRKPRSESVQNFTNPSVTRLPTGFPRSLTANRINPFDVKGSDADEDMERGYGVKFPRVRREETLTSDYCSEIHDSTISVLGIPNPLYDTSYTSQSDQVDDHKEYALALNHSLASSAAGGRYDKLRKDVWSQLMRLTSDRDQVDYWSQPLEETIQEPVNHPADSMENDWSVLTFGGREAGHVTAFDRPLSMWTLRL